MFSTIEEVTGAFQSKQCTNLAMLYEHALENDLPSIGGTDLPAEFYGAAQAVKLLMQNNFGYTAPDTAALMPKVTNFNFGFENTSADEYLNQLATVLDFLPKQQLQKLDELAAHLLKTKGVTLAA